MAQLIFPKNFIWGTATAAYQIEGAANEDGRGESIWDRFSHIPGNIVNGDNGDIACDHYHKYKEDIKIMKEMGINGYRLSTSWSRILPEGKGKINQKGIDFYDRLVDELLEDGIDPAVTLYHWDLPQALQDIGGWGNRDTIEYFAEYAAYMYNTLGDRVKKWITHNEPWVAAYAGNLAGRHAPGLKDFPLAVQVSHHLMLSHAKAVEAYRGYNDKNGKIGITLNLFPTYAASDSEADKEAAAFVDGYHNRWFLDPVLKGEYPEDILKVFKEKLNSPVIMPGDMKLLADNKSDFLGVNYYFRRVVKKSEVDPVLQYEEIKPVESQYTDMNWEVYPQGLYDLLTRIKKDYNDPVMYITENGAAFKDDKLVDGVVEDNDRVEFLKQHFIEAERAIKAGVKLEGYYVWSMLDNFEWAYGYDKRFGIIYVDYETQNRIWKRSAHWYKNFLKSGKL